MPLGPPASPSDPCASVPPWYSCAEQSGDCRRRQLRWRQRRGFRRLRRWIRQQLPRGQRRLRRRSRLPRGRRELRLEQQKQQQIQRWRRRPERRLLPHSDSADLHPQFAQARGGVAGKRLQYLSCRSPPPPPRPPGFSHLPFPNGSQQASRSLRSRWGSRSDLPPLYFVKDTCLLRHPSSVPPMS